MRLRDACGVRISGGRRVVGGVRPGTYLGRVGWCCLVEGDDCGGWGWMDGWSARSARPACATRRTWCERRVLGDGWGLLAGENGRCHRCCGMWDEIGREVIGRVCSISWQGGHGWDIAGLPGRLMRARSGRIMSLCSCFLLELMGSPHERAFYGATHNGFLFCLI